MCVPNRRQFWRRNSKSDKQVRSNEYRVLSSSMDVPCCGLCIVPQLASLMTTYSTSLGPPSITWNAVTYTCYLTGTSETGQSGLRDPVDQAMMLVECINSAFTRHCPWNVAFNVYCTTRYNRLTLYVIIWLTKLRKIKLNWRPQENPNTGVTGQE